ncbi:MAG: NAD-dependent epimerase/dehydratase family protein [Chromatiaceae bacterium]|jgi:UDP-glucose 4-epimerase|nr:NAD-dependent epimerase/dehydratase family protein [Chromatiaceae bacterium]MBP6807323.1 NAD-dependent epimerase/dehydratase family protein [Chromatiaceae bacterium]MBP8196976.1 NAD-dependent epimerase/dehydratase family protein [Chromatiaceae bacterium]MBP8283455.1 NAD-dependent epimerase/dehydratase family protein [Chromatiaceae bacterium]
MTDNIPENAPFQDLPVLVTGATGKVGRHLVQALLGEGARVTVLTRAPEKARTLWPGAPVTCRAGDLGDAASLAAALVGIDCVFHLASYSPGPDEADIYEAPAHWTVSAEGTRNLVAAAVLSGGIHRLVYLSSIKVMGDAAGAGPQPADEQTAPLPDSLYGRAKLEAERQVLTSGGTGGLPTCVLRLPMVYGLAGQGNIARMIDAVARHRFPPWPPIDNRRSAIHVEDAIRAALLAAWHPQAVGQIFLVTDGEHYSTRWLYKQIRLALGLPLPRWAIPLWVLWFAASLGSLGERLTGRAMPLTRAGLSKLTGDAWFSSERIRQELGFQSHHRLSAEIPLMVRDYRRLLARRSRPR